MLRIALATLLILGLPVLAEDRGTIGLSASWRGLMPGVSRERNVVSLLGPGYFQDTIGDTGSRTYVSDTEKATLVFAFGIDHVISSIELRAGIHYPAEVKRAQRKRMQVTLYDQEWSGWEFALHLGSTKVDARDVLGFPTGSLTADEWVYTAYGSDSCEGPSMRLTFKNNLLAVIELLEPEYE